MPSSSWSSIALIVRMVMFGIICTFSIFILGIDAHIASALGQIGMVNSGNIFSLVIALLTLLTLIPLLAISIMRKGHVVNMIGVELGVMGVLWILWVAASALTTEQLLFVCDSVFTGGLFSTDINNAVANCSPSETLAVQAFAWLNWVISKSLGKRP
jgi:hypothetical protein